MNKKTALLLILILAASSIILAKPSFAQTSKPSVPEFNMKYHDYSYDIPPTYKTNQFTGQKEITDYGEHVDNRTVEFRINNQPFTPYINADGNNIRLYYNFRFKGGYGNDWSNYPDLGHSYGRYTGSFPNTSASNSGYSVIDVPVRALTSYYEPSIPSGSKVEFQVQAIFGNVTIDYTGMLAGDFFGFAGEFSDWSNTQTITLTEGSTVSATTSPTSTPNSTPSLNQTASLTPTATPINNLSYPISFGSSTLTIIIAAIAVAFIAVTIALLLYVRRLKTKQVAA